MAMATTATATATATTTTPTPTVTRTKAVTFDEEKNDVHLTECLNELAPIERRARWYSVNEIKDHQSQIKKNLKSISKGESAEDFELRGLEHHLSSVDITSLQEDVVRTVIDEQGRQRNSEESNAEAIAELSQSLTAKNQQRALKMAESDAMSVPELAARVGWKPKVKEVKMEVQVKEQSVKEQQPRQQQQQQQQQQTLEERQQTQTRRVRSQPSHRSSPGVKKKMVTLSHSSSSNRENGFQGLRSIFGKTTRKPSRS